MHSSHISVHGRVEEICKVSPVGLQVRGCVKNICLKSMVKEPTQLLSCLNAVCNLFKNNIRLATSARLKQLPLLRESSMILCQVAGRELVMHINIQSLLYMYDTFAATVTASASAKAG